MPADGIHGVGYGTSAWLVGRGLCRYELGGWRMLVIGLPRLEADAKEDEEACVSRDDEYFRGASGLEMRRTSCIYTIKDHGSIETSIKSPPGGGCGGVPLLL